MAERVLSYVTESIDEYRGAVDFFIGQMFHDHPYLNLGTKNPIDSLDPLTEVLVKYGKLRPNTDKFACFVRMGREGFESKEKKRLVDGVMHQVEIADPNKGLEEFIRQKGRGDLIDIPGGPHPILEVGYKLEYKENMLIASIAHPSMGRYFL